MSIFTSLIIKFIDEDKSTRFWSKVLWTEGCTAYQLIKKPVQRSEDGCTMRKF